MWRSDGSERVRVKARLVACAEGCLSGSAGPAGAPNRVDGPDDEGPPAIPFYCPASAEAGFGPH